METIYFLDLDHSHRTLFVMKQTRGQDAKSAAGPFDDHGPAFKRMEELAHKWATKRGGKVELTTLPDWAQAQDGPQFQAHSCFLIQS